MIINNDFGFFGQHFQEREEIQSKTKFEIKVYKEEREVENRHNIWRIQKITKENYFKDLSHFAVWPPILIFNFFFFFFRQNLNSCFFVSSSSLSFGKLIGVTKKHDDEYTGCWLIEIKKKTRRGFLKSRTHNFKLIKILVTIWKWYLCPFFCWCCCYGCYCLDF